MQRKYRISTLGCKVNQYESQQVRELLESFGLREASRGEDADLAIVNTCAVTCSATAKSRKALRRVTRGGKTPTLAIGCYATADADAVTRIPGVAEALGHDTDVLTRIRDRLVSLSLTNPVARQPVQPMTVPLGIQLGQPASRQHTNNHSISSRLPVVNQASEPIPSISAMAGHTRAFLKIQDGCDASCTYCIIPKLRPTLRSKSIAAAVAETRQLVERGYREIVLTGIFLGAYGRETALRRRFAPGRSPLADLVEALARVKGLARLRLSSLEPGDMTRELMDVLTRHDCCVPHFHLPLQSGSGEILRRMNRQYTVDAFLRMIDRVRTAMDQPAITTDVIVGFPGETDADFEQTLETARYAGFCKIHAFPYSPRPGTAAIRWKDTHVHNRTVTDRMQSLTELEFRLAGEYADRFVGSKQRVLVERIDSPNRLSDRAYREAMPMARGRTDRYFEVFFDAEHVRPGDVVDVSIDRISGRRVHGRLACVATTPAWSAG